MREDSGGRYPILYIVAAVVAIIVVTAGAVVALRVLSAL